MKGVVPVHSMSCYLAEDGCEDGMKEKEWKEVGRKKASEKKIGEENEVCPMTEAQDGTHVHLVYILC